MKSKELKSFQNLILRQIIVYLKKYTLLKPQEVRKIFPSQQLYAATLYWLLFFFGEKQPPKHPPSSQSPSETLLNYLVALEITFKAVSIHETIKEDIPPPPPGEQAILLKNTRKILLGDMLIATSINIVNNIPYPRLQREFFTWTQDFFLKRVETFIPPSRKNSHLKTWNWFAILFNLAKKEKDFHPQKRVKPIINLLSQSPHPEKVARGIEKLEALIKEILATTPKRSLNNLSSKETDLTSLVFWLRSC